MRKLFLKKQKFGPCCKLDYIDNDRGISTSDIIITIVSVIIIVVSTIFLVSNIITLRNVNRDIDDIKATINAKQEALNQLIELGKSEDMLKEDYDRSELYIPGERDEVGITSDVTSIISESDALFRKITFDDEVTMEDNIVDVPFTVRVDGTYEDISDIINKLENTDRLYIISSLVIVDSDTGEGDLTTDILMHAYYREN